MAILNNIGTRSQGSGVRRQRKSVMRLLLFLFLFLTSGTWSLNPDAYAERIKDIATFEGMRENQLIGYGLVVGLDGSGDKGDQTIQVVANLMQRMGITVKTADIKIQADLHQILPALVEQLTLAKGSPKGERGQP